MANRYTIQIAAITKGPGVRNYVLEADLLAASPTDGTVAYAEDTATHYLRQDGAWLVVASTDYVDTSIAALDASQVDVTRTVTAGTGLTGGGDLSADRTLNVVANADGSIVVNANDIQVGLITDAQHGDKSTGTLHAAVIASGASGFMTGADKAKLDTVAASAAALTSSSPAAVGTSASVGSASTAAKADHVHAHGTQTDGTLHAAAIASGASGFLTGTDKAKLDGIAASAAALTSSAAADVSTSASAGSASTAAKADHVHKLSAAAARNARYQAELTLNIEDYGGDPTGLSDSATAWNNIFSAAASQASSYGQPARIVAKPGTYKIMSEVSANELLGVKLDIVAPWALKFYWQGTGVNKTMLTLRNCRDVDFGGFVLDIDTAGGVSALQRMLAMVTDTNAAAGVSTQNILRQILVFGRSKADVGMYWNEAAGSADSGNDYHWVHHCTVYAAVTASYQLEEGQSKGVQFEQCFSYNSARGLYTPNQGGAFNWKGGFLSGHTDAAFYLDNVIDPISIIEAGGEDNNRFAWWYTGDTGNGCPVEIRGCRMAANGLNADGRIMILGPAGPYRIIGNQIGTHGYAVPRIRMVNTNPASILLEDNTFEGVDSESTDPLSLASPSTCKVTRHRNRYRTAANAPSFRTDEDREILAPNGTAPVTDNAIVRYDGTAGTLAQNSLATIDDSGNISVPALATVDGRDVSVDGAALDARLPSTNEKAALAGTSGTAPSGSNKLVDTADTRLTDSRAPSGSASGDLGGSYPSPTVTAIHETSGPTKLTLGSVTDGYLLVRSGSTLIGYDKSSLAAGPASATDNALVRFDATTGKLLQNSAAILDDSANLTGVNSLATTTYVQSGSYVQAADSGSFKWASGQAITRFANNYFKFANDDASRAHMYKLESSTIASLRTTNDGGYVSLNGLSFLGQAAGAAFSLDNATCYLQQWGGATYDTTFKRAAATFWEAGGASGTAGGGFQFTEISDPSAPAANKAMLYAKDDGSGNTLLVARFNGGSGLIHVLGAEDGMHRWLASTEQTTVGAAGGASALPGTPTKFLKVKDSAGTTLVIPAYAAS